MAQNRVRPIVLVSIDASTLNTEYQPFNSAGLDGACFYIRINNESDDDVAISYDGINDHELIKTETDLALNFQTNAQPNGEMALLPKGLVLYIKSSDGATGTVYLSGYYVSPS